MAEIHKTLVVPYSSEEMFNLVNDVESYPNYLPWCSQVQILEKNANSMQVLLKMNFYGISFYFETYNTFKYSSSIDIKLISGPFKKLDGFWSFSDNLQGGTLVQFKLNYQFKSGFFYLAIQPFFDHIAKTFIDFFIKQAEIQSGKKK